MAASIVLQRAPLYQGVQQGVLIGPVTGNVYSINPLGQAIVSGTDAPTLIAMGWRAPDMGSALAPIIVDFGAFPGSLFASTTIPAVSRDSSALVEAFVVPVATADHSADEHTVDGPVVYAQSDGAGNIVISATANNNVVPIDNMMPWGKWSVAWNYLS
jgi:hypothetical protein